MAHGFSHGIPLKKKFGQHFLRDQNVTRNMLAAVHLDASTPVFEIGCGDGFLTKTIVQHPLKKLWVFEIDHEWADYVRKQIKDPRVTVNEQNFLDLDFSQFEPDAPWVLLSNLPYQVTFPILHRLQQHRHLLKEGVVMVQDEVAEKITKTSGRGYGFISLFFQYYFTWKKLDKIPPGAFYPPPKVYSRLLHFKPKTDVPPIKQEEEFWRFIKACFRQPRRTLRNNLLQTHIGLNAIPTEMLELRAQQLSMQDFLTLWQSLST